MGYHAYSLARQGAYVNLVGYMDNQPHGDVFGEQINFAALPKPPISSSSDNPFRRFLIRLVKMVTRADVEVQPYAFTTKSLYVGHLDYRYLRWQVIDTPGILDHPLEQRNTIEMQAITALAHLKASILYMMDISEQCGRTLEEQIHLFESIQPLFSNKPVFVGLNKIDLITRKDLIAEKEAVLREKLETAGVPVVELSTLTQQGITELRDKACDALLAQRVEKKLQVKGIGQGGSVISRLFVAYPTPRDDKVRAPHIPETVLRRHAEMEVEDGEKPKRKLERELELEQGMGVQKLLKLRDEEKKREEAGFYDSDMDEDDEETRKLLREAEKHNAKRAIAKNGIPRKEKHKSAENGEENRTEEGAKHGEAGGGVGRLGESTNDENSVGEGEEEVTKKAQEQIGQREASKAKERTRRKRRDQKRRNGGRGKRSVAAAHFAKHRLLPQSSLRRTPTRSDCTIAGTGHQVSKWPVNPLEKIVLDLGSLPPGSVVADLGCGDAEIAKRLGERLRVHSFDLVASNERVLAADMADLPLESESVDVCVYCLSLMGHKFGPILPRSSSTVKIKIAEITSRLRGVSLFVLAFGKNGIPIETEEINR
ncbi:hypothetical protein niasHT_005043 [Heterodera trifolii]|uniref:Ribosomal RNA-processing protein 8 n=1 Tax=Heterodera trifolii TaxID=157864 RepID=A0ABD2M6F6_9BILA